MSTLRVSADARLIRATSGAQALTSTSYGEAVAWLAERTPRGAEVDVQGGGEASRRWLIEDLARFLDAPPRFARGGLS